MIQKSQVENTSLKSDISDAALRIRKSYPCKDTEGKVFAQKEQWDERDTLAILNQGIKFTQTCICMQRCLLREYMYIFFLS